MYVNCVQNRSICYMVHLYVLNVLIVIKVLIYHFLFTSPSVYRGFVSKTNVFCISFNVLNFHKKPLCLDNFLLT